jgi:hypothetical protein
MRQFPSGTVLAVTGSWEGGWKWDLKLAETLELYGWKVTLFVDPHTLGTADKLTAQDLRTLTAMGHEIGLALDTTLSPQRPLAELRQQLGQAADAEIVSIAYPVDADIDTMSLQARQAGFQIGRTRTQTLVRLSEPNLLQAGVTGPALCDFGTLQEYLEAAEAAGDGILHLHGSTADYSDDTGLWADLECNLSWPCGRLDTWYRPLRDLYLTN